MQHGDLRTWPGPLGVRVWVLLSTAPDWRWLTHGETTDWYPTMRLFRQQRAGEWGPVMEQVADELQRMVKETRMGALRFEIRDLRFNALSTQPLPVVSLVPYRVDLSRSTTSSRGPHRRSLGHPSPGAADRRPQRPAVGAARPRADSSFEKFDISQPQPKLHTDIPRLRKGGLGGVFWSVYVPADTIRTGDSLQQTLEQIDLVQRMVRRYPEDFELALDGRRHRADPRKRARSPR